MKITDEQLLDEALAIRAEATLVRRCPRCGSDEVTGTLVPGTYTEGSFRHEHWCPAIDDNVLRLARRANAEMRHFPLETQLADGRPALFVLAGRKGKPPLSDDQLDQLLSPVSREKRN